LIGNRADDGGALYRRRGTMLASPGTAGFYFAWTVLGSVGWCWVLIMFYVDMKFLDFGNKRLDYL
jgi:hypothetical protein